jgi:hypothetical protein
MILVWPAIILLIFANPFFGQSLPERKIVAICTLNDSRIEPGKNTPIKPQTIERIIGEVSEEYERNVNISLVSVEHHDIFISMNPNDDHESQLRDMCGRNEIVAVFTNREYAGFGGYSSQRRGIVWDFNVDHRIKMKKIFPRLFRMIPILIRYHAFSFGEEDEYPALTLRHEIAHLFMVDHSLDDIDFMYPIQGGSSAWSDRIRRVILENRERTFE